MGVEGGLSDMGSGGSNVGNRNSEEMSQGNPSSNTCICTFEGRGDFDVGSQGEVESRGILRENADYDGNPYEQGKTSRWETPV